MPGRVPAPSRLRWSSAATLALTVLVVSPGAAQDLGSQASPTGAPPWVDIGTQVSYHVAQATLDGGVYELVEDPNGPLTDPTTGTRYRESYGGTATAQGSGTGSGQGILQIAVAGFDGSDVLLSTSSVLDDPISGTRYLVPAQVRRSSAASPGLPWVHPEVLAGYRTGQTAQVGQRLVLTGELTLGGTTYQTISVVDPTAGSYTLMTYDAATGVVLQSASRTQSEAGGPAALGTLELRGIRQPGLPGVGAAVPAWLTPAATLRYAGTQRWTNTFDGSYQDFPATLEVTFPEVGPTWARYASRTAVTMLSEVAEAGEGVVAGAGPYWWDPTALAAMTQGQVLDTDPVTGQTVTVSQLAQGAAGPAVLIETRLPGVQAQSAWDVSTGVMLGQVVSTQATGIATQVELQAMP